MKLEELNKSQLINFSKKLLKKNKEMRGGMRNLLRRKRIEEEHERLKSVYHPNIAPETFSEIFNALNTINKISGKKIDIFGVKSIHFMKDNVYRTLKLPPHCRLHFNAKDSYQRINIKDHNDTYFFRFAQPMEEEHEDPTKKNYLCSITIYNYYYTEQIYLTEKEVVKVLFGGVEHLSTY